jgi:hypothetical protein
MHMHICFEIVKSLEVFPTGKGIMREELFMEECFGDFSQRRRWNFWHYLKYDQKHNLKNNFYN